jgi:hypothetical protein
MRVPKTLPSRMGRDNQSNRFSVPGHRGFDAPVFAALVFILSTVVAES